MHRIRNAFGWVWRSAVRQGWPRSAKEASVVMTDSLFLHIHPAKVRRRTLAFRTTLGLGFLTAVAFAVLVVTGIVLTVYYVPHPSQAYRSMLDLRYTVSFGWLFRNLHRWAAHAMVALVFFHLCRVFYTAAYKAPRQFNWVVGVLLFLLTLGLSFTGYLLPWDQLAFWAITVGTSIATYAPIVGKGFRFLLLGGHEIGESALLRFYILHCFVFPAFVILLIAVHVWRVRKDGGLAHPDEPATRLDTGAAPTPGGAFAANSQTHGLMALMRGAARPPTSEPEDEAWSWPHLMRRETALYLVFMVALMVWSLLADAPLEELADPTRTPNPAKAPWYFLGLQELVHYSALIGGVLVPVGVVLALLLLPYLDREPKGVGIWFARERRVAIALFTATVLVAMLLIAVGTFFRGPNWTWVWPW